jgi:hypothetical protein
MSASLDVLRELLETMRTAAVDAGRDPDAIEVYTGAMARPGDELYRAVDELTTLGVDQVVLPAYRADRLASLGEDLMARFG